MNERYIIHKIYIKETIGMQLKFLLLKCLLFTVPLYSFGQKLNTMTYNSMRLAYYHRAQNLPSIPDFLIRAKSNRYNYILGEFRFRNKQHTSDPDDLYDRMKNDLKNAFTITNQYGLRLIPLIQMGSCWSRHWELVKAEKNHSIQMNSIKGLKGVSENGVINVTQTLYMGCPSFAYEPQGIDKSFKDLLLLIKEAYKESNASYPLEFVHLGHDEPCFYTKCLIGCCERDASWNHLNGNRYFKVEECQSYSQNDRDDIIARMNNTGCDIATAFQQLLVSQLHRRIT